MVLLAVVNVEIANTSLYVTEKVASCCVPRKVVTIRFMYILRKFSNFAKQESATLVWGRLRRPENA